MSALGIAGLCVLVGLVGFMLGARYTARRYQRVLRDHYARVRLQ